MRLAFWITLAGATLAALFVLVMSAVPLGVPGEWEWNRAAAPEPLWLAVVPLAGAGLLYLGFVWLGASRIERCRPGGVLGWLAGLVVAGFAWLWMAQESAPANFQLSKAVWVLFFRGSSGYFWEARYEAQDLRGYLRGYANKMEAGDVLHIGTHPPGLIILFRALLAATNAYPRLAEAALATQPDSVRLAFVALEDSASPKTVPMSKADRAALWMGALIAQACAALAVFPLFGLARRTNSRRASWLAAALWPAVPALALFLPKSDCAFPFVALGAIWLWLTGLDRRDDRGTGSAWRFVLAGIVFWLGMTLSLAFLAVGAFLLVTTLARGVAGRRERPSEPGQSQPATANGVESGEWRVESTRASLHSLLSTLYSPLRWSRALAISALWAGAGFAGPTLAVWVAASLNLPLVWWLNFHNHARFYAQFPRTWWKWLLVNPLELSLAAGVPLAVAAAWSIGRQLRANSNAPREHVWGWLVTLGFLWLSGKNMGEAARLWIFLIPALAWCSAPLFETVPAQGGDASAAGRFSLSNATWLAVLAVQLAMCGATLLRVTGFHYP